MDFERIAASAPVNRMAAIQTSKGTAFEPRGEVKDCYRTLPKLKTITPEMRRSQGWMDLRGVTVGRLTVVGLMQKNSEKEPASWVCRCKCGYYCSRKSKSLKSALKGSNSFVPMCGMCDYQARLRAGWTPNLKLKVKA